MALIRRCLVAVLVVVAVLGAAEATLRRRSRCHPQVKYVTEYVTQYQKVPVEKTVYRERVVPTTVYQTQVKTQVQQQYVTVCPKQQPSYGYGGR